MLSWWRVGPLQPFCPFRVPVKISCFLTWGGQKCLRKWQLPRQPHLTISSINQEETKEENGKQMLGAGQGYEWLMPSKRQGRIYSRRDLSLGLRQLPMKEFITAKWWQGARNGFLGEGPVQYLEKGEVHCRNTGWLRKAHEDWRRDGPEVIHWFSLPHVTALLLSLIKILDFGSKIFWCSPVKVTSRCNLFEMLISCGICGHDVLADLSVCCTPGRCIQQPGLPWSTAYVCKAAEGEVEFLLGAHGGNKGCRGLNQRCQCSCSSPAENSSNKGRKSGNDPPGYGESLLFSCNLIGMIMKRS